MWLIYRQVKSLWLGANPSAEGELKVLGAGCMGASIGTWVHNMAHSTLHWIIVWLFFAMASSLVLLAGRHKE